jgi:UDP-2,3-diacylglucosamine hydrolase
MEPMRCLRVGLTHGAVLIKLPKPDQEARADPPTIGLDTVALAARIGLAGIVVSSVGTLVFESEAVIAAADRAGLFLYAVE